MELGYLAGIAFQIHDDLLNLEADETLYGKESERRPLGGQAHGHAAALHAHGHARRPGARAAHAADAAPRKDPDEVPGCSTR